MNVVYVRTDYNFCKIKFKIHCNLLPLIIQLPGNIFYQTLFLCVIIDGVLTLSFLIKLTDEGFKSNRNQILACTVSQTKQSTFKRM